MQFDDDNLGYAVISDVADTLEIAIPEFPDKSINVDSKKENNSYKLLREISLKEWLKTQRLGFCKILQKKKKIWYICNEY